MMNPQVFAACLMSVLTGFIVGWAPYTWVTPALVVGAGLQWLHLLVNYEMVSRVKVAWGTFLIGCVISIIASQSTDGSVLWWMLFSNLVVGCVTQVWMILFVYWHPELTEQIVQVAEELPLP
jgi:cobalamin biosynthesis protein CobD/CbiB